MEGGWNGKFGSAPSCELSRRWQISFLWEQETFSRINIYIQYVYFFVGKDIKGKSHSSFSSSSTVSSWPFPSYSSITIAFSSYCFFAFFTFYSISFPLLHMLVIFLLFIYSSSSPSRFPLPSLPPLPTPPASSSRSSPYAHNLRHAIHFRSTSAKFMAVFTSLFLLKRAFADIQIRWWWRPKLWLSILIQLVRLRDTHRFFYPFAMHAQLTAANDRFMFNPISCIINSPIISIAIPCIVKKLCF